MKKVIIIGAGNVGKNALDFLGTDFVECFADNKKKGMTAYGKRVISIEEAVDLQKDYILLLALTNYLEELKDQLRRMQTKNYYYFDEAIYFFDGIKQWKNRLVYEKKSLWELFIESSLDKALIIGREDSYAGFLSELFGIEIKEFDVYAEDKKYLLNMGAEESEDFLHRWKIEDKSNLWILPQMQHKGIERLHERLRTFRGRYVGKRCFIIGNGPSLRMEDLDRLDENGEICFGMNVIHKAYENTKWRPNFVCVKDPLVIVQNYESIKGNNSCPILINDKKLFYYWESDENEYPYRDIQEKVFFSEDIIAGCSSGASVSYTVMQIAAYMGFSEIYLLGMDCSNWGEHFNGDYWAEKEAFREPDEVRIFRAYQIAEEHSKTHGFRIFNATRGGCLEVFQRVDFDSLFGKEIQNESCSICPNKTEQSTAST